MLDIYNVKPKDIRVLIKKVKEEVSKRVKKNVQNYYANIDILKLIS
jgi:hypothetical protein